MAQLGQQRRVVHEPETPETPHKIQLSGARVNDALDLLGEVSGIKFPDHNEHESPNKRSKSPAHDIKNQFTYLFFKDRDLLDRELKEFLGWLPAFKSPDEKLNHLLDKLTIASRSCIRQHSTQRQTQAMEQQQRPGAPKSNQQAGPSDLQRQSQSSEWWLGRSEPALSASYHTALSAPPSPTISIKHAPKSQAGPPPPIVTRSGEVSAETSFWSKPSQEQDDPGTPATSVDSVLDLELDGTNDDDDPQKTEFPMSSVSESVVGVVDQIFEHVNGIAGQQQKTADSGAKTQQKAVEWDTPRKGQGMSKSSKIQQQERPSKARQLGSPDKVRQFDSPGNAQQLESPSKLVDPLVNYRVGRIVEDGLTSIRLPESLKCLPFDLAVECHRVLQTEKISAEDLNKKWRGTRTMESLHKFAEDCGIKFQRSCSTDFKDRCLTVILRPSKEKEERFFVSEVQPPRKEIKSTIFEDKFGRDRIMQVTTTTYHRPPSGFNGQDIQTPFLKMLGRQHEMFGRRWALFLVQDKKTRSTELGSTKSDVFHLFYFAVSGVGIHRISISELLDWALDFRTNAREKSCKLFARLDLFMSRTHRGPTLLEDQVKFGVEDEVATVVPGDPQFEEPDPQNPCTTLDEPVIMTDGNSLASVHLFDSFYKDGLVSHFPAVAQIRIGGNKGTIQRDLDHRFLEGPPPKVLLELRKSMMKVKRHRKYDPELWTIRINAFSNPPRPSHIYPGSLPILVDRGVPKEVFYHLATQQVKQQMEAFQIAIKDGSRYRQWMYSEQKSSERATREHGIDSLAGLPRQQSEKIIALLEAGFEPTECKFLADEIVSYLSRLLNAKAKNFKISLLRSTVLQGVPDPIGILKPDEVHVSFSEPLRDPSGQKSLPWDGMDIVLQRNPALSSSDIQKAKCVRYAELDKKGKYDCFVFSTQGQQPFADKLSGGDYDGDTFWGTVEPLITKNFTNAPASMKKPPPESFGIEVDNTKISDDITIPPSTTQALDDQEVSAWALEKSALRMAPSMLGIVTREHEALVYTENNINTAKANSLVHLHDLLVDADKNGYRYTATNWKQTKRDLGVPRNLQKPAHRVFTSLDDDDKETNEQRPDKKLENVIDYVYYEIVEPNNQRALDSAKEQLCDAKVSDDDLNGFHKETEASVLLDPILLRELRAIFGSFEALKKYWDLAYYRYKNKLCTWDVFVGDCRKQYLDVQPKDTLHPAVKEWIRPQGATPTVWERLKASGMARCMRWKGDSQMLFTVAGDHLMFLKATQQPGFRLQTETLHRVMRPYKFKALGEVVDEGVEDDVPEGDEDNNDVYEIDKVHFDAAVVESPERVGSGGKRRRLSSDTGKRLRPELSGGLAF